MDLLADQLPRDLVSLHHKATFKIIIITKAVITFSIFSGGHRFKSWLRNCPT
jgi:hypothetical protein